MGAIEKCGDNAWDSFFDFVTPDIASMTDAEVKEQIRRIGIDMEPARKRVREALEAARARQRLLKARELRPGLIERYRKLTNKTIANARETLHKLITQKAPEELQPVYFRKLEEAASDEDIESLLQEMIAIDELDIGDVDDIS